MGSRLLLRVHLPGPLVGASLFPPVLLPVRRLRCPTMKSSSLTENGSAGWSTLVIGLVVAAACPQQAPRKPPPLRQAAVPERSFAQLLKLVALPLHQQMQVLDSSARRRRRMVNSRWIQSCPSAPEGQSVQ
jgi:hypothetical protein